MKIHHATAKKAKAYGIVLTENSIGTFQAIRGNAVLAATVDPMDALDLAILESEKDAPVKLRPKKAKFVAKPKRRKARKQVDDEEPEDDEPETKSIIKAKYRVKYKPFHMTCGDGLAIKVRDKFMTKQDPDTHKPRLDFERFVMFAKNNDCWAESYRSLKDRYGKRNNGLIRMNVINRLRKLARNKAEIKWDN